MIPVLAGNGTGSPRPADMERETEETYPGRSVLPGAWGLGAYRPFKGADQSGQKVRLKQR